MAVESEAHHRPAPPAPETRDRIVDAAEELFADHGFRDVSLRQITAKADANLAAVNYHFGSKDALVFEVLSRVIGPINEERLRMLDAVESDCSSESPAVEAILDAAFRPMVSQVQETDHSGGVFLKLAGRCMSAREEMLPETMLKIFREVADRFVAALQRALPGLSESEIYWRLHFSIGVLLYTLTQNDRLVMLSRGVVSATDPEETLAQTIAFSAGGMKAPPAQKDTGKAKRKAKAATTAGLLAALGLIGVGCAAQSPADAKHQAELGEVPEKWVAEDSGEVGAKGSVADYDWIESFGDKRLEELVDEALENNKDLKAAAARIEIAGANARLAGADLYPQIDGNFRGSRQKRNFIGFPFGGDEAGGAPADAGVFSNLNNEFGLSLDMRWEIDLWGRIRDGQSAAIAEFEASEDNRAAAQLSIAGQTAKAWFSLLEAREQVTLAEKTLEAFGRTETAIQDRHDAGIGDPGQSLASQLRLSMVDVASAEDSLQSRRELLERAARQIDVLTGQYPAADVKADAKLPAVSGSAPAGMPAEILDRRPDLRASERRLAAADKRFVEAKKLLLPAISLSSSGGTSSEQVDELLNGDYSIWSLAANAVQPIFRGGVIREGIRLRRGEIKLAAAEYEGTVLNAFSEVENALAAEKFLAKRVQSLKRAADLALEAYQSSEREFADGTGDILTMLTAQQRAFRELSLYISIRRQRLENRIDLHLALGGDFPRAGDEDAN